MPFRTCFPNWRWTLFECADRFHTNQKSLRPTEADLGSVSGESAGRSLYGEGHFLQFLRTEGELLDGSCCTDWERKSWLLISWSTRDCSGSPMALLQIEPGWLAPDSMKQVARTLGSSVLGCKQRSLGPMFSKLAVRWRCFSVSFFFFCFHLLFWFAALQSSVRILDFGGLSQKRWMAVSGSHVHASGLNSRTERLRALCLFLL